MIDELTFVTPCNVLNVRIKTLPITALEIFMMIVHFMMMFIEC